MKAEIKKAWIDAMLSGEYKQGREQLRTQSDEFCCLGVLCDLHRKMTGRGEWKRVPGRLGLPYILTNGDSNGVVLPNEVQEWAGLPENTGVTIGDHHLASLNDSGTSFAEIAKIIEKYL